MVAKLQLDMMKRLVNCWVQNLNWYSINLWLTEYYRRWTEELKEPEYHEVFCEKEFLRKGFRGALLEHQWETSWFQDSAESSLHRWECGLQKLRALGQAGATELLRQPPFQAPDIQAPSRPEDRCPPGLGALCLSISSRHLGSRTPA